MSILDSIYGAVSGAVGAVSSAISSAAAPVVSAVQNIGSSIASAGQQVASQVTSSAPTTSSGQQYISSPIQQTYYYQPSVVNPFDSGLAFAGNAIQQNVVSPIQSALSSISTAVSPAVQFVEQYPVLSSALVAAGPLALPVAAGYTAARGLESALFPKQTTSIPTSEPITSGLDKTQPGAQWSGMLIPTYNETSLPASTLSRAGYYDLSTLGDSQTQQIAENLYNAPYAVGTTQPFKSYAGAVGTALEQQRQEAYKTPTSIDDRYYLNELQKLTEDNVESSSAYHYEGMKSGVPVAANPFEYKGDIAVQVLKGSADKGFSPVSGEVIPYLPSGKGLQDYGWDIAEGKAEKVNYLPALAYMETATGMYGPYGNLYGGVKTGGVKPEEVSERLSAWSGLPPSASVTSLMPTQIGAVEPISKPVSSGGPIEVLASNLFQGKLPSIGELWSSTPVAKIASNWTWDTSHAASDINTALSARPKMGTEGLLDLAGIMPFGSEIEEVGAPVAKEVGEKVAASGSLENTGL